jgi:hypothetical protein
MLLLSLTSLVNAQDGASTPLPTGIDNKPADEPKKEEPAPAQPEAKPAETPAQRPEEHHEEPHHEESDEFLKNSTSSIRLESISPAQGPTTGDTKVVVRGGPFAKYQAEHPEPKCRFGDVTVGGMYVPCPIKHPKVYEREGGRNERTTICIQCENNPPLAKADNV